MKKMYHEAYNAMLLGDFSSSIARDAFNTFYIKYNKSPIEIIGIACEKAAKYDDLVADLAAKEEAEQIMQVAGAESGDDMLIWASECAACAIPPAGDGGGDVGSSNGNGGKKK